MAIKFIEPILDQFKTILQRDLSNKLLEIDAEKDDGITTDPVLDEHYSVCQRIVKHSLPWIEIYPTDSPGEDFTNCSVRAQHEVNVRIYAKGKNEDDTARKVYRYLRAITEVIKATDDLELYVDLCQFSGHSYEDWEQLNGGAYIYGGYASFMVDHEEVVQPVGQDAIPTYLIGADGSLLIGTDGSSLIGT